MTTNHKAQLLTRRGILDFDDLTDTDLPRSVINPERKEESFEQEIFDSPANCVDRRIVTNLKRLSRNLISQTEHQALLFCERSTTNATASRESVLS